MFLQVCGWLFILTFGGFLIALLVDSIRYSTNMYYEVKIPSRIIYDNVRKHMASGTWYGYYIEKTGQRKIVWKIFLLNLFLMLLLVIWFITVVFCVF